MASLISPGVSISVVDESQYASTAVGTVAYILIASDQDKLNTTGALATYTTKANANNVSIISSQRELVQYFGTPTFRVDASLNPIHADERNEYGLLAAYSALGVGNQVLIQRADVNLAQLVGTSIRPSGHPGDGAYWLDLSNTNYGIYEWDTEVGFNLRVPTPITDTAALTGSVPKNSFGAIGEYAISSYSTSNPVYYKRFDNTWTAVGSDPWMQANPTVVGTIANPGNVHIGQYVTINGTQVQMTGTNVSQAADDISDANIQGVIATISAVGQLELRIDSLSASTGNIHIPDGKIHIAVGTTGPDAAVNLGLLTVGGPTSATIFGPSVQYGSYVAAPAWRSTDMTPRPSGSIWLKTSAKGNGADWVINYYNSALHLWQAQAAPLYVGASAAIGALDSSSGGSLLPVGTLYVKYDLLNVNGLSNPQLTFKPYVKQISGILKITGKLPAPGDQYIVNDSYRITVSVPGASDVSAVITLLGTDAPAFIVALQSANLPNIAVRLESTGAISISHLSGGTMQFEYITGSPLVMAGFTGPTQVTCAEHIELLTANTTYIASPFAPLVYIPATSAPFSTPQDGTLWYYSNPTDVDIMMHDGSGWKGYRNVVTDARGYNLANTDPVGVILASLAPIVQTAGTALVPGDLWIDTNDLENFPVLYRYTLASSGATGWTLVDLSDDNSSDGIVFADARWAGDDVTDPVVGTYPAIPVLLKNDYLDDDAPDYRLHARGTLLFNTRRSGFNVKRFESNWFATAINPPVVLSSWVTTSGKNTAGFPYFGHKAQRNTVVEALRAAISSSTALREDQLQFNLIACPGYPELMADLITLNDDRQQTAFIVGDSPITLDSSASNLQTWITNTTLAAEDGVDGLVSRSEYLGVYYPSGYTNDLAGNLVVVPPSHMMLRTIIRSDNVSYPWFAPAGVQRGAIDNASAIGFVNLADNNKFVSIGVTSTLRDILYANNVNPITVLPGAGLLAYGQKTRSPMVSSMDRINVSRLICYLRIVLDQIARPFIFEPNDTLTRNQVKQAFEQVFNDLIAKRGITDYVVVCDDTNNTSGRIARNELWIDIAIEPTRAIEFVYIPVRLKNPGDISSGH